MPYDLANLSARSDVVAYFGYGSLVNPHTHRTHIIHSERAHLSGFRRKWQERSEWSRYPVSFLSANPVEEFDGELSGLLIFDHAQNLPAVDRRESGYDRVRLAPEQLRLNRDDMALPDVPCYVYVARPPARFGLRHHILQSYLDAVLQGYLHQFGEQGAVGFVQSTDWSDTPVLRDRSDPLYARHVLLAPAEREFIDHVTSALNWVDEFQQAPLRGDIAAADRL